MQPKIIHLRKIKVAAVSYLNTKPLLYGITHHKVSEQIELVKDYPAKIAQMLIDNDVDLGLVPVTVISEIPQPVIVTDFCIGCDGAVASVCLFSDVPMKQIEQVYLDYQSRTSSALARILLKEHWKKNVEFIESANEDFRMEIKGTTAAVIIGDRALEQRQKSKFIYDLGEAWKNHTGLPFVFAAWIGNKQLPLEFVTAFNEANAFGLKHLDEVIADTPDSPFDLKRYYTQCISYDLTDRKKNAMDLFLTKSREDYLT
ncbi:MAG: menaquinone biosynthesis protein [Chitinophagaceae bacterium]|nr:menaquinone biosynthesis protein [Chitinophagaceae bacterium]